MYRKQKKLEQAEPNYNKLMIWELLKRKKQSTETTSKSVIVTS